MPSRLRSRHEYLEQRLDAGLLADQRGQGQGADPRAAARGVGHERQIDVPLGQAVSGRNGIGRAVATGRDELHAGDESAGGELGPEPGLRPDGHRRPRHGRFRRDGPEVQLCVSAAGPGPRDVGRELFHGQRDLTDVFGCRAAAAPDQAHAAGDEAARVRRHVLGRTQVDVPALDVARLAGVGLRRQGHAARRGEAFDGLEHRRRADAAVDAHDVGAAGHQGRAELLRRRAVEAVAVFLGRDQGHDRQLADGAHGVHGGGGLVPVAEGLEHQQVHAALDQRGGLLAKDFPRLVDAGLAPRLDAHPERPDRPGHVTALAGGLTGQLGAGQVYCVDLVAQTEGAQLEPRGAEGVGFDDVGAGREVFTMDVGDQGRLREIERLEAAVDEDALAVQHRAHRAVTHEHAGLQGVEEGKTAQRSDCGAVTPAGGGTSSSVLSHTKSSLL